MAAQLILMTRPRAQSERFARALGMDCVISPLIAPRFLAPDLPPHDALILTSETGAEAAARLGLRGPAFCVGDRTAEVARGLGFDATSAQGDATALLALILCTPRGRLLHLRGQEARGEIAVRLMAAGQPCAEVVVYAQEERPLTPQAQALLQGQALVIAPVFSPRTAELLAAEAARIGATAPLRLVALSPAVAKAGVALDPQPLVAARPDGESMLEAVLAALNRSPLA